MDNKKSVKKQLFQSPTPVKSQLPDSMDLQFELEMERKDMLSSNALQDSIVESKAAETMAGWVNNKADDDDDEEIQSAGVEDVCYEIVNNLQLRWEKIQICNFKKMSPADQHSWAQRNAFEMYQILDGLWPLV